MRGRIDRRRLCANYGFIEGYMILIGLRKCSVVNVKLKNQVYFFLRIKDSCGDKILN